MSVRQNMYRATLTLMVLACCLAGCAHTRMRHVVEDDCSLDLPASWRREEILGIDSRLVRYRGENLLCEIEFGVHLGSEKAEVERLRQLYARKDSSQQTGAILRVGKWLGQIETDGGDQNVDYVGFRYDTLLYVPTYRGYVTVRMFYRDPTDQSVALRILQSVAIQGPTKDGP